MKASATNTFTALPGAPPQPPATHVPGAEPLPALANLMHALSDPTRLRLLEELSAGERNVTRLCEALDLPQPTVSHHLGLLATAGLLSRRRAGKRVFYHLGPNARATVDGLEVGVGGSRILVTRR